MIPHIGSIVKSCIQLEPQTKRKYLLLPIVYHMNYPYCKVLLQTFAGFAYVKGRQ